MPAQLSAHCHVSPSKDEFVLAQATESAVADKCFGRAQADCRRLLHTLSVAGAQLGDLSGSLSMLSQALTHHHALFNSAVHKLSMRGAPDWRVSVVGSLRSASSSAIEIVGIHIAIASVRSELIMANHDHTSASTAVRGLDNCLAML